MRKGLQFVAIQLMTEKTIAKLISPGTPHEKEMVCRLVLDAPNTPPARHHAYRLICQQNHENFLLNQTFRKFHCCLCSVSYSIVWTYI